MKKTIAILFVTLMVLTVLSSAGIASAQAVIVHPPTGPPVRYHRCPPGCRATRWVWYNHRWITGCLCRYGRYSWE